MVHVKLQLYDEQVFARCYTSFVAGKKRLGPVNIQWKKKFNSLCNRKFVFSSVYSCSRRCHFSCFRSKSNHSPQLLSVYATPYGCDLRDLRTHCSSINSLHFSNKSSFDSVLVFATPLVEVLFKYDDTVSSECRFSVQSLYVTVSYNVGSGEKQEGQKSEVGRSSSAFVGFCQLGGHSRLTPLVFACFESFPRVFSVHAVDLWQLSLTLAWQEWLPAVTQKGLFLPLKIVHPRVLRQEIGFYNRLRCVICVFELELMNCSCFFRRQMQLDLKNNMAARKNEHLAKIRNPGKLKLQSPLRFTVCGFSWKRSLLS